MAEDGENGDRKKFFVAMKWHFCCKARHKPSNMKN